MQPKGKAKSVETRLYPHKTDDFLRKTAEIQRLFLKIFPSRSMHFFLMVIGSRCKIVSVFGNKFIESSRSFLEIADAENDFIEYFSLYLRINFHNKNDTIFCEFLKSNAFVSPTKMQNNGKAQNHKKTTKESQKSKKELLKEKIELENLPNGFVSYSQMSDAHFTTQIVQNTSKNSLTHNSLQTTDQICTFYPEISEIEMNGIKLLPNSIVNDKKYEKCSELVYKDPDSLLITKEHVVYQENEVDTNQSNLKEIHSEIFNIYECIKQFSIESGVKTDLIALNILVKALVDEKITIDTKIHMKCVNTFITAPMGINLQSDTGFLQFTTGLEIEKIVHVVDLDKVLAYLQDIKNPKSTITIFKDQNKLPNMIKNNSHCNIDSKMSNNIFKNKDIAESLSKTQTETLIIVGNSFKNNNSKDIDVILNHEYLFSDVNLSMYPDLQHKFLKYISKINFNAADAIVEFKKIQKMFHCVLSCEETAYFGNSLNAAIDSLILAFIELLIATMTSSMSKINYDVKRNELRCEFFKAKNVTDQNFIYNINLNHGDVCMTDRSAELTYMNNKNIISSSRSPLKAKSHHTTTDFINDSCLKDHIFHTNFLDEHTFNGILKNRNNSLSDGLNNLEGLQNPPQKLITTSNTSLNHKNVSKNFYEPQVSSLESFCENKYHRRNTGKWDQHKNDHYLTTVDEIDNKAVVSPEDLFADIYEFMKSPKNGHENRRKYSKDAIFCLNRTPLSKTLLREPFLKKSLSVSTPTSLYYDNGVYKRAKTNTPLLNNTVENYVSQNNLSNTFSAYKDSLSADIPDYNSLKAESREAFQMPPIHLIHKSNVDLSQLSLVKRLLYINDIKNRFTETQMHDYEALNKKTVKSDIYDHQQNISNIDLQPNHHPSTIKKQPQIHFQNINSYYTQHFEDCHFEYAQNDDDYAYRQNRSKIENLHSRDNESAYEKIVPNFSSSAANKFNMKNHDHLANSPKFYDRISRKTISRDRHYDFRGQSSYQPFHEKNIEQYMPYRSVDSMYSENKYKVSKEYERHHFFHIDNKTENGNFNTIQPSNTQNLNFSNFIENNRTTSTSMHPFDIHDKNSYSNDKKINNSTATSNIDQIKLKYYPKPQTITSLRKIDEVRRDIHTLNPETDFIGKISSKCKLLDYNMPEFMIEKQNDVFVCSAIFLGEKYTSRFCYAKEEAKQDVCKMICETLSDVFTTQNNVTETKDCTENFVNNDETTSPKAIHDPIEYQDFLEEDLNKLDAFLETKDSINDRNIFRRSTERFPRSKRTDRSRLFLFNRIKNDGNDDFVDSSRSNNNKKQISENHHDNGLKSSTVIYHDRPTHDSLKLLGIDQKNRSK